MKKLFLLSTLIALPSFSMVKCPTNAKPTEATQDAYHEMLIHAAANGKTKWVEALCHNYMDCISVSPENEQGATPLFLACQEGHDETVGYLLYRGARAAQELLLCKEKVPCTALHIAATKGHTKIVDQLMKAGARINSQHAPKKQTPLHYAVAKRHTEIAALLIAQGADLSLPDEENVTVLDLLKSRPYFKEALLEIIKEKNFLIIAARTGNITLTNQLIALKIDTEERDPEFNATPLMWAANYGYEQVVKSLLAAGANVWAKNKDGLTAWDCARKRGNELVCELLTQSMNKALAERASKEPVLVAKDKEDAQFLGGAF